MDIAATLSGAFEAAREELAGTEPECDPWEQSPYRWIRELQTRRRGKAGELIVTNLLRSSGYEVAKSASSESDRQVGLHQVEIKLSTQWENGQFAFQQIRDQEYRYMILLGVTPTDVKLWVVPKRVVMRRSTPQHTGRDGAETRWLCFDVNAVPQWLNRYGGTVEDGLEVVERYLAVRPSENTDATDNSNATDNSDSTGNADTSGHGDTTPTASAGGHGSEELNATDRAIAS